MDERPIPKFRLLPSGKVRQRFPSDVTEFDPDTFTEFRDRSGNTVRAVKLPGKFQVGGDVCTDGYLVVADGKLSAISTSTFARDYEPVGLRDAA